MVYFWRLVYWYTYNFWLEWHHLFNKPDESSGLISLKQDKGEASIHTHELKKLIHKMSVFFCMVFEEDGTEDKFLKSKLYNYPVDYIPDYELIKDYYKSILELAHSVLLCPRVNFPCDICCDWYSFKLFITDALLNTDSSAVDVIGPIVYYNRKLELPPIISYFAKNKPSINFLRNKFGNLIGNETHHAEYTIEYKSTKIGNSFLTNYLFGETDCLVYK